MNAEDRQNHLQRPNLQKEIGLFGFFSLAFGSIIGVGWVTALGSWLTNAGPLGAILAFSTGGLLMIFIGLCYAEVTPMLPLAGGEVAYAYKAYGAGKAFIVGWFLAFGYLSVSAFEAISIGKVISFMVPEINIWPLYRIGDDTVYAPHLLLALIFTCLITLINLTGVRKAAVVQSILTIGFIGITVIFIAAGIWEGRIEYLRPAFSGADLPEALGGMVAVLVTVPFWYVGFDTIPQGAEEAQTNISPKKLGIMILAAIIAATLFYAVLIFSAASAGPWLNIIDSELPTAAAFEAAFRSRILANLVLAAALIGLLTSWNGFFLAGSRVLFALGRGKIIPGIFGLTHRRFGTPAAAVLLSGLITFLAALMGRGAMIAFVDVGSFCIAVAFLGVTLSTIALRKKHPRLSRPYRMPGGLTIPYIALAGSCLILAFMLFPNSPAALVWPIEWFILGVFILLGMVFWYGAAGLRGSISERQRQFLILEDYADQ